MTSSLVARLRALLSAGLLVAFAAAAASAAPPAAGDPAPELLVKSWLNVKPGEDPTAERLRGKVVMIEFWGTWCGPCVRAMPHVQELWDRYRDRGLTVLAISYEAPDAMKPFLDKHGYTMPVGSDPDKATIGPYGVRGWPSTFVIGKDGKIAYAGDPYGVEAAIETALGLEASPATLLTQYLAARAAGDAAKLRPALERLVEKAPPDFDVKGWATAAGGAAAAKPPAKVDAGKALGDVVKAGGPPADAVKKQAALDLLASAPAVFDLSRWAREAYGREFPITAKDFATLLAGKNFEGAMDALLDRRPSGEIVAAAAKCIPFAVWCTQNAAETRAFARKGLLCKLFPFADRNPKDNDAFWADLSVNGLAQSQDKKHVVGIIIGGRMVMSTQVDAFVERQYARAFVMDAIKDGDKPALAKLEDRVADDVESASKQILARYEDKK